MGCSRLTPQGVLEEACGGPCRFNADWWDSGEMLADDFFFLLRGGGGFNADWWGNVEMLEGDFFSLFFVVVGRTHIYTCI